MSEDHPLAIAMRQLTAQLLDSQFRSSAAVSHKASMGHAREQAIARSLEPLIPPRFSIAAGVATNEYDAKSKASSSMRW
jgi:hypothetical protein